MLLLYRNGTRKNDARQCAACRARPAHGGAREASKLGGARSAELAPSAGILRAALTRCSVTSPTSAKKKLSTTTTTHTRAHIAHINFKRWRDTRDHTASWPREAFANEAGLTHASSPPAPRTVCPSSETASSLLAEKFRKANYLASTVRQSASMSISFRLQLHYSERKYCCWQSAVPLPSAQVRLWQLALSPSTLYMYKSTLHSNGSRRITNKRSLWFMESDTRLDQKSVEALEIGLRLNLGLT